MNISDTLKKIEKALDLRFERDTSLYISKEDTEKIKKALYNSQFQNVNAFIKKFGNKIVGKIILKNSWLIDFQKNKKELKKIFDSIDRNFLAEIAKDIVEDKVFSTLEFKLFINQYYLKSFPIDKCESIYKDKNERVENRSICLRRYLKKKYILENPVSHIVRFIDEQFKQYPKIYEYLQIKDPDFLSSVFKDYDNISEIYKWIIEYKITDRKDKVWHHLFLLKKEIALTTIYDYISKYPSWDNFTTKYLIQKVLAKLNQSEDFQEKIINLYKNNRSIRLLFIHMIEPPKFKNKKLANSILDEFENIGLPNKSENSVKKIREWEESSSNNYKTKDEIIADMNNNQDFENLKTLNYFFYKFSNTSNDVILNAYYNLYYDDNIVLVLSYFLAKTLEKREIDKELEAIEYIEKITYYIDKLKINTKYSKAFLEKNNKLDVLAKFNKR